MLRVNSAFKLESATDSSEYALTIQTTFSAELDPTNPRSPKIEEEIIVTTINTQLQ